MEQNKTNEAPRNACVVSSPPSPEPNPPKPRLGGAKEDKKSRVIRGVVVSDKMNKTVVVAATRLKEHPKYRKRYKVTKRYKAHDEKNEFKVGDKVIIGESLPLSKEKRWIVKGFVQNSKP